ncbi:MAG: Ferritin-like domain-containing protein [Thermocaproicibacter melissae]|jgi:rubrerythrin|uniref:ferritin-like domain-containing protein n=1 Tax=Thermocaproicibacter melissae TaxID=2966552 RepID=UPI0024B27E42|nr:ferritin-like domain-containing protein [Thermocaproicibacter melissae]WBY64948.1 ferritin-like domain-containing protein [Thermocaproicibacter melissae]
MVTLSQKERFLIQDLQDQEKLCIEKYEKNQTAAKDTVLKDLFGELKKDEQRHYDSLGQVLNGTVPSVNTNDTAGKDYNPKATYTGNFNQADKDNDSFLCTDSISVEKYVSSAYNFNLFQFGNSDVRRLLNDIETEEQNHAERIYKYKTVNQMM